MSDFATDPVRQKAFNDAYIASQPPALRVVLGPNQTVDKPELYLQSLGSPVAVNGKRYPIDPAIMALHWDPYQTMLFRRMNGLTWVPALGQPIPLDYDPGNPPADSIIVPDANSVDLASFYLPFDHVVSPPPQIPDAPDFSKPWTGAYAGFTSGFYSAASGNYSPAGSLYTAPDSRLFQKFVFPSPWGGWQIWGAK